MNDGASNYDYTKSLPAVADTYNYNVTCSKSGFDTLNTTDAITCTESGEDPQIPEFSFFGILLIILVAGMGLFIVSKRR